MIYLIGYLTALATFIVLDVAWLSVTIPRFYQTVAVRARRSIP
jgi:uncharacterized membrane protein